MKYGESGFIIVYLLFALGAGLWLLGQGDRTVKLMGTAALVLGCGDAFHLVPRVLNHFVSADFSLALGLGKLVTSVTMTVFYALLYLLWLRLYRVEPDRKRDALVFGLAALRILLCLPPQNGWLQNESPLLWAVLRNLPFTALGAVTVLQWYRTRLEKPIFRRLWLYVTLSFLFYLPVALTAGTAPMLGMLMLPKTVCYMLILALFLRWAKRGVRA
ncbi:MAG: hypothetical protein IJ705_01430 [Oscillospiraceae bacterium]|nr:hypothetical protein [Oscillospiraceae bacterium]